ncbi:hypothetical protein [Citrobacter freundii]
MKILLWVILIIFLIGLLVVTGVFKMIFLILLPISQSG